MPKAFSDTEKEHIRARLRERGRELFAIYGLRKTNIDELARAASISKGAFYLFFDSKEQLFFELLEQFEAEFQAIMLDQITHSALPPRARMAALLAHALTVWKENALFTHFAREEYEYLARKLPPATLQAHLANDTAFAERFKEAWLQAGVALNSPPEQISGLIRGLFFMSMHEDEFGAGIYPAVIQTYVELLARHLVNE